MTQKWSTAGRWLNGTDRNHKDLLRDIRGYIEVMEKSDEISARKIAPIDFFHREHI